MELKDILQTFLNKSSSHKELFDASRNLAKFFEKFSNISVHDSHQKSNDSKHTNLTSGVALSPLDAAICINEYMRTTKYIRGVYDALNDLLDKFKDEKIHLLYAGTGPYATLVTPLLHLFTPKRLEITFLDIHKSSLDSVKAILDGMDYSSFVKKYECCDATTYKCDSKVHMMVTETMRLAFEGEPQVNITLNLLPQLCKDGIFVPESVNIHLEVALKKLVQKEESIVNINDSEYLADIIRLDTKKQWNKDNLILTPSLEIKEDIKIGYDLFLCTQIKVYKEHILNENESSLNIPFKVMIENILKGDILKFSYEFENRPEILYKNIRKNNSVDDDRNFYPIGISHRYKNSMILWQEIVSNRFLKPFFSDETKSANKRYLSWQKFEDIAKTCESLEPKGFIFHTSRCGSTLLSNALSCLEKNIVIKESAFIHDILTLDYKEDISKEVIKQRLKSAIRVLGRKRFDFEENFYIKFNSWEISYLDIIKELYPHIPIIILYTTPQKILNSHKKKPGMQMIPNLLDGKIFDSIPKEIELEKYPMKVLENIFEEIFLQRDKENIMFINYKYIKEMFFTKIAPFFTLELNEKEKNIIKDSFNLYSKDSIQKYYEENENNNEIYISDKLISSFAQLESIKDSHEN